MDLVFGRKINYQPLLGCSRMSARTLERLVGAITTEEEN